MNKVYLGSISFPDSCDCEEFGLPLAKRIHGLNLLQTKKVSTIPPISWCVFLSFRETVEPEDLLRVRKRERLLKLEAVGAMALVVLDLWSRSVLSIPSLEVLNTIRKDKCTRIWGIAIGTVGCLAHFCSISLMI